MIKMANFTEVVIPWEYTIVKTHQIEYFISVLLIVY